MTSKRLFKESATEGWGVLHHSDNAIDGERSWLESVSAGMARHTGTLLFKTRAKALEHIKERHGYIADRPDLKSLGWSVPKPVRVTVTVTLAEPSKKRADCAKAVMAHFKKRRPEPVPVQDEFLTGILGKDS